MLFETCRQRRKKKLYTHISLLKESKIKAGAEQEKIGKEDFFPDKIPKN